MHRSTLIALVALLGVCAASLVAHAVPLPKPVPAPPAVPALPAGWTNYGEVYQLGDGYFTIYGHHRWNLLGQVRHGPDGKPFVFIWWIPDVGDRYCVGTYEFDADGGLTGGWEYVGREQFDEKGRLVSFTSERIHTLPLQVWYEDW